MPATVPAVRASRRAAAAAAARHAASSRRQLSGTARTASPDRLATDAAKSPEDVMALISSITANLTRRLATTTTTTDDGSHATTKRLSPSAEAARAHPDAPMLSRNASFADVFPSTSSSQGLGVHATTTSMAANTMPRIGARPGRGSTASLAAAARNILPSFTPEPAHNAANLFRLPPPPPHARRAQGLYKLQTLAASPDLLAPPPVLGTTPGGNVGLARLGRPGSAVATRLGAPETAKIDLDFLEPRPAQTEADKSAELASKALAEWDRLIVDMQTHTMLDAPAAAAAGDDPLAGLENLGVAAAAPRKRAAATAADRSAPYQAPNLSSLARHLATTATTTTETAATAEPSSETPGGMLSLSLFNQLSPDDLSALQVQLQANSRSVVHLRAFLDTLFRYLPTPPPAILAAALAAARHLGDAHLAYAVLAQLRSATRGSDDSSGIVAMLRAADASVFGELLKTAWDVERSVPRMARILRDMDAVGLRPDRNSRMFLEQVLASAPMGSSPLATGQPIASAAAPTSEDDAVDQLVAGLEAALGARDAKDGVEKVGATASFEDAQMLWDTLLELDWTRMFRARPQQQSQPGPQVGGARGSARDAAARELAGLGLADLMRHGIKPAAEPETAPMLAM
ncbi:hypothetical protein GGF32_010053 [Allomyces javanicus]|nr:hypothetical protein GGF32_010053 [Allomyces javanicus]